MTSLVLIPPYSEDVLRRLYPEDLELQQVQILLRHGERTPVSARFQNVGLAPYWPYCTAARRLTSVVMNSPDGSNWDSLRWRRKLEHFGPDDRPVLSAGWNGDVDGVCFPGELTDKGRKTTLVLGQRLRNLYINQLDFMPGLISSSESIYLRTSPIPRALESVLQAFWGMYPPTAWTSDFSAPTIVTREHSDETLFPNSRDCRRFRELSRIFSQRAADKWNDSSEMEYVNGLISAWMPPDSPRVAVDSRPRLSGINDTVTATLAHGPDTRLPPEFYDPKARQIMEKIGIEEWYTGYAENREFRTLGIGALMGDIVERMSASIRHAELATRNSHQDDAGQINQSRGRDVQGQCPAKFAMTGCHDSTMAAILSSLGAFKGELWPPFTSHIAVELFRKKQSHPQPQQQQVLSTRPGWFRSFFTTTTKVPNPTPSPDWNLETHYVRLRYNDRPITIPGCSGDPANHLPTDNTFCTMTAFKAIVDEYTPKNWKRECEENLGTGVG